MLHIYRDVLDHLRDLRGPIATIQRHDRDLARQLRRAAARVLLNLAEGAGLRGGHARERFGTSLGSAMEVRACLDAAEALGYFPGLAGPEADRMDKIIATLWRLAR